MGKIPKRIVAAYCSISAAYKLDLQHTGFFVVKYAPNCITLKTKFQTEYNFVFYDLIGPISGI